MKKICSLSFLFVILFCSLNSYAQVKKKTAKKPITTKSKATVKPKPAATLTTKKIAGSKIKITTDFGEIIVRLYDKTPRHRDNFIKLVNAHFYDSLLFHRVINGFMIQGGDPKSKNAPPNILLGDGDIGYMVPAEFDTTLYHKKGALAAARNGNPEKASSGCQFYIVQGKKYTDEELNMIEMQNGIHFSPAKRMTYKMLGGTPMLDMNYTVFGEVVSGLDVVDKIATAQRDGNNRPFTDIHMKMELLNDPRNKMEIIEPPKENRP